MRLAFKLPYVLFFVSGVLLAILSFFSQATIDFHVHDTYFIIAKAHFLIALSALFLFFWIAYVAANKIIYKRSLVWLHLAFTILPTLVILFFIVWGYSYYILKSSPFKAFQQLNQIFGIALLVLVFAQLIFLINMIIGIIQKLMRAKY